MTVPLLDLGSLMLYATRRTALLPNMAVVSFFDEWLSHDELDAEAQRLAANPYGLGRNLYRSVVPGSRPLWRANSTPPPVAISPELTTHLAIANWLADEMSVRLDPLDAPGWRLAAAPAGDGMYVSIAMNHLYGAGRDVAMALWGEPNGNGNGHGHGHGHGGEAMEAALSDEIEHDYRAEAADLANRLSLGFKGIARLGNQAFTAPRRRDPHGDVSTLRKPLDSLMDDDPSRGRPSARRVAATATVDRAAWDEAAAERGGSRVALQVAMTANLLREARRARGGPVHRPLRIIIPVDVADRTEPADVEAAIGPLELTSAGISLPGGLPTHNDLALVRNICREAFAEARAEVAATGKVPVAPGMVDAMRLLPDAITARAVMRVHARFDGAASSMGPLLPAMSRIGDRESVDTTLLAFPMGSDLSITMAERGESLMLGAVADPSRLGAGPPLSQRLTEELESWGLEPRVR